MKKIFTLMLSTVIAMAVFAGHRPIVTLKAGSQYEIVIDGKTYFSFNGRTINIADLEKGRHVVRVYEIDQRFLFRKTRKLVSSAVFRVNNRDVNIIVDHRGMLKVTEVKYGKKHRKDRRNADWHVHRNHRY